MKPRIIDYDILAAPDQIQLIAKVREAIKNGWQPAHGLHSRMQDESGGIFQTMVKYAEGATIDAD